MAVLTRETLKNPTHSTEVFGLAEQLRYEIDLLRRVPEMKRQRKTLQTQLEAAEECLRILELGFEPYTPSLQWPWGWLSVPRAARDSGYSLYRRGLPVAALEKLMLAKRAGIKHFTVHSPDAALFETVRPRLIAGDPVLVGWVNALPRTRTRTWLYGLGGWECEEPSTTLLDIPSDAHSFLIAQWDMARDLAFHRED